MRTVLLRMSKPYAHGSAIDLLDMPLSSSLSIIRPLKANRNRMRKNSTITTALWPTRNAGDYETEPYRQ